jgi:hypothetical protein
MPRPSHYPCSLPEATPRDLHQGTLQAAKDMRVNLRLSDLDLKCNPQGINLRGSVALLDPQAGSAGPGRETEQARSRMG